MGDDGHVPDVGRLVHDGPDLVYCEVHHGGGFSQADPSELVCAKDGDDDSGREPDLLLCSIYVYALPVYLLSI